MESSGSGRVALVVVMGLLAARAAGQPPNDECAGAVQVFDGITTGLSNVGATTSTGPAFCANANSDVWFVYVATCTGPTTISTCGGGNLLDTVLQVLSGPCGSPSVLGCNDDACAFRSSLTVPVTAGVPYWIRVADFGLSVDQGTFNVNINCGGIGPPNDECAGAAPITDGLNPGFASFGATTSSPPLCGAAGSDVWFSYVASCTGQATFSLCSPGSAGFNSALQVFAGPCGSLTSLGCNDDFCGSISQIAVPVAVGSTYFVRVGGVFGVQGPFQLYVSCAGAPANDECVGATQVFAGVNSTASNVGATTSFPWTGACSLVANDVWHFYVAACTGSTTFSFCPPGSASFAPSLQIFSGTCGALPSLACGPAACSASPGLTIPTTVGTTTYLRIGGFLGATGNYALNVLCPPPNDECMGAAPVTDGVNPGTTNAGSTTSFPWPCAGGGSDVWFSYVASCSGVATFSLCPPGSAGFDSAMEVFTGTCGSLTSLLCNDNFCGTGSQASVPVTLGTTTYVRVGGSSGLQGPFDLSVACGAGLGNDECAGATPVFNGLNPPASTVGATTFPPVICTGVNDVWHSYVATCTGSTTFSFCPPGGATFNRILEVYSGTCGVLTSLGCSGFPCADATVPTAAGTTYYLRVGGFMGATGDYALNVLPNCPSPNPACTLFLEDFESGGLGSFVETDCGASPAATLWHGEASCDGVTPLPGSLGTNAASYNQGDLGLYHYDTPGSANCGAIQTPPVLSSAGAMVSMTFDTMKQTQGGGTGSFDQCFVEARPVGGVYVTYAQVLGDSACVPTSTTVAFPGLTGPLQQRFRFDTLDANLNGYQGWTVDNVVMRQTTGTGSFSVSPTGCGVVTIAPSGTPSIGGTVSYALSNNVGSPVVWFGLPVLVPLCPAGCALGASFLFPFPGAILSVAIPCDPALIGATASVQGADFFSPGGCVVPGPGGPVPFTVTNTINTTIG